MPAPSPAHDLPADSRPIGVFDSGIGGFSVLRPLTVALPNESFVYVADSANAPYGGRTSAEVTELSEAILQFLLDAHNCKLVVIACNTATAASAKTLRARYPDVPIVGMEPAVKPAARATRTGIVGVMATAGTIASEKYGALLAAHGDGLTLVEDPCVGLVRLIEAGDPGDDRLLDRLRAIIEPMRDAGVDTIVLGCTHFPLVEREIAAIAGPGIRIIDPAPAVVRRVQSVLRERQLEAAPEAIPQLQLFTTGDKDAFRQNVTWALGEERVS